MFQRPLSSGLCFAGLTLVAVAAVGYWLREGEASVTIEETEAEVQVGGPGEEKTVVFWIRNPTRRAVRVLGLEPC